MEENSFGGLTLEIAEELLDRYAGGDSFTEEEIKALSYIFAQRPDIAQKAKDSRRIIVTNSKRGKTANSSSSTGRTSRVQSRKSSQNGAISRTTLNNGLKNRGGSWRSQVTSPGGFKKSGYDEDSQARMGAADGYLTAPDKGVPPANLFADGSAYFNGRKFTKGQVQAIIKRGNTGATLGLADQAIFDRYNYNKQKEAEAKRDAAIKEQELKKAAYEKEQLQRDILAYAQKTGTSIPSNVPLSREDVDKLNRGEIRYGRSLSDIRNGRDTPDAYRLIKAEDDIKERDAIAKADEAAKKDIKERRQKEIDEGLKSGSLAYTLDQKARINEMRDEIDAIREDESKDEEEKDAMIRELYSKIDSIRMNPHENIQPEKSLEERFAGETYKDKDGIIWTTTKEGWKVAYNPLNAEAKKAASDNRQATLDKNRALAFEKEERSAKAKFMNDFKKARMEQMETIDPVATFTWDKNTLAEMNNEWDIRRRQLGYLDDAPEEESIRQKIKNNPTVTQNPTPKEPKNDYSKRSGSWRDVMKTGNGANNNSSTPPIANNSQPSNAIENEIDEEGDICIQCKEAYYDENGVCPVCGHVRGTPVEESSEEQL